MLGHMTYGIHFDILRTFLNMSSLQFYHGAAVSTLNIRILISWENHPVDKDNYRTSMKINIVEYVS